MNLPDLVNCQDSGMQTMEFCPVDLPSPRLLIPIQGPQGIKDPFEARQDSTRLVRHHTLSWSLHKVTAARGKYFTSVHKGAVPQPAFYLLINHSWSVPKCRHGCCLATPYLCLIVDVDFGGKLK